MNFNDMNAEQRQGYLAKRRSIDDATHYIGEVSKLPKGAHFAVLVDESRYEDDGYGGSSYHHYVSYIAFDNDEALEDWLIANHSKKTFKVINVKAVDFEMRTSIHLRSE